ncbi:hypothetical protein ACP70R_009061 [Stipagrostis hirtigluma subsp. patula]
MARLSVAAVLLMVVIPLCMYTCALLVGVELGRAIERRPDSINISLSVRGVLDYIRKELWDTKGQGRDLELGGRVLDRAPTILASRRVGRFMPSNRAYTPVVDLESSAPKINRYYSNHTSPRGVISVGPWGGSGGRPFYTPAPSVRRLRSIILYHSDVIHSLAYEYSQADHGVSRVAGPWGLSHSFGSRGVRATIELDPNEYVTAVEGTIGHFANVIEVVITSLTFRTNTGRTYGPYGGESSSGTGTSFSVPAANGACIVGFWGRSGWLLDAIGVYIKPSCFNPRDMFFVSRAYENSRNFARHETKYSQQESQ